jgi:hypothetical protein
MARVAIGRKSTIYDIATATDSSPASYKVNLSTIPTPGRATASAFT